MVGRPDQLWDLRLRSAFCLTGFWRPKLTLTKEASAYLGVEFCWGRIRNSFFIRSHFAQIWRFVVRSFNKSSNNGNQTSGSKIQPVCCVGARCEAVRSPFLSGLKICHECDKRIFDARHLISAVAWLSRLACGSRWIKVAHIFPESSTKARSVNRKIGGIEITRLSRGLKNEWHWALKLFEILESQWKRPNKTFG